MGSGPFGQYTSAGGVRISAPQSESGIEAAMEQARWRFGGLRVAPYFGLRRASYHDNVFATSDGAGDQVSDLTATVGAGFDAYLKTGSHVFYSFEVQPDYVYWVDLDERNQIVGRYSVRADAFFNRLTFGVRARRHEVEQVVTPEFAQPVTSLQEGLDAVLSVRLGARFAIALAGDVTQHENRSESAGDPRVPEFNRLDREQRTGSASLVWTLPNGIELGGGWQETRAEFDANARALSARGSGPLLSLRGDGNRLDFQIELYQSSVEPEAGSQLAARDIEGGRAEVRVDTGSRVDLSFFGQRNLLFAIDDAYSDLTHLRYGVRLRIPIGQRAGVQLFTELGEDDFQSLLPDTPSRTDDAFSWGASFEVPLPRAFPDGLNFQLGYRQMELDSNLPGFDREFGGPILNLSYSFGDQFLWQ